MGGTMEVRLNANLHDKSTDFDLASIQVNGGLKVNVRKKSKVYSQPLLILFAAYRLWILHGRPPEDFRLSTATTQRN